MTDLAHLVDIPTVDASLEAAGPAQAGRHVRPLAAGPAQAGRHVRPPAGGPAPIALRIDLLEEEESLRTAMRVLATDPRLRESLARAGHAYWLGAHTLDMMATDYRRVMKAAAARPARAVANLPAHFTDDYTELARSITRQFGVDVDMLGVQG